MRRQDDLVTGAAGAAGAPAAAPAPADGVAAAVAEWNTAALEAAHAAGMDAAQAAHTLAALHTCMYNAWAAYDDEARQTVHGVGIRLPRGERDAASQAAAMQHAARVLLGARLPFQAALFDIRMAACGLGQDAAAPPFSPAGIGKAQAQALAMLDANPAMPFAALPGGIAAAPGAPDGATLERCWARARQATCAGRLAGGQDVLLYLVLANALADAGGAGASAAAEVLRRFGVTRRDGLVPGQADALGREIGARVFDKARRYRQGRL
ncbi:DUF6851 domain-containing protein [Massilia sp. TN1-12]|uniref:DUF6851 domain-containing protein n=1 Tax=Massilia paldalensis TaxID=3377675 RepID=UPI0038508D30